MAEINIPGVSDKYKTNEIVSSLVEVERLPLKREQEKLDVFKTEQENWRRVNQYMNGLRDASRDLYSFNNPFNDKLAKSSNEAAVTAEATRDAQIQPFKVQVVQLASADRFVSKEIDKNHTVPAGTYTIEVGDKSASIKWGGGTLSDFIGAFNKRSNNVMKLSMISVTGSSRTLMVESLKTGSENKLVFKDAALPFALDIGLIKEEKSDTSQNNSSAAAEIIAVESVESEQTAKTEVVSAESIVVNTTSLEKTLEKKYAAQNPIDTAGDAVFLYEGIKMTRPSNKIDDAVPAVTLYLNGVSSSPAAININPDTEGAKNAVINFVGKYNQLLAEINILTQNKPEVINELGYLSDDEKAAARKRLGTLIGEFSLNNSKQTLIQSITIPVRTTEGAAIRMLSDIGIASKTSAGAGTSTSQLRGYLEIDEKKLDDALKNNIDQVKNLFGYDSVGDLIVDSGVAFNVEKQLQSYTQIGGIIASKTTGLDTKIKSSETQIKRLETQVASKEVEIKRKYAQMESALNSLNAQSNAISNFSNQNSGGQK